MLGLRLSYLLLVLCLVPALCSPASAAKLGTHFFYWYDAPSNNVDRGKMPYHPPGLTSPYNGTYYSSLSTEWYKWQLRDMLLGGIDYAFPVSWGENYQSNYFKQSVLSRMVDAIRQLGSPIKIGLYDDTTSEAAEWNADNGRGYVVSETDPTKQLSCADPNAVTYFYDRKIKPFFQMIPRDLWATHNGLPVSNGGRPLILTYVSYYYKDVGSSAATMWQNIKNRFAADFGVQPYLVLCWSWWYFGNVSSVADAECVYGAANSGIWTYNPRGYTVSNLGPGCDTRRIGRTDYRPRWSNADTTDDMLEDQWLRDNFHKVPANANLVMLESWNELWEGTAISRCTDYPRRTACMLPETYYMDKTREQMRWLRDQISSPTSLANGTMEGTYSNGIAPSWTTFHVYGDVTFAQEGATRHGGSKAQRVSSTGWTHLAGVYQRISASVGDQYTFSAWTWRSDDRNDGQPNEETWVGIDPTGGVDPTSTSIVWSSGAHSYWIWTQQSVTTTAWSDRITVFIRARANHAGTSMTAIFDDAALTWQSPSRGAISGLVRDQSGAGVSGASVSTGYLTALSEADGSYSLPSMPVGTYSLTASKEYYSSQNVSGVSVTPGGTTTAHFTIAVVPPDPVLSFACSPSDGVNRLSWTNPPTCYYKATLIRCKTTGYPIGPADGDLVCDRIALPSSADSFDHTGLANGVIHYYAAFARDDSSHYSSAAHVSGAPNPGMTCAQVEELADSTVVDVTGTVTAVFPSESCIYIQDADRASGVRVSTTSTGFGVGDRVSVTGTMGTYRPDGLTRSERQIVATGVSKLSSGVPPAPLGMNCRSVGGAARGLMPGVKGGNGANNMGLLVKVAGKVTLKVGSYIYVDDGSSIEDIWGRVGVMVQCPDTSIPVSAGSIVRVTGVVRGSIPSGWTENRRLITVRSYADIAVVGQ